MRSTEAIPAHALNTPPSWDRHLDLPIQTTSGAPVRLPAPGSQPSPALLQWSKGHGSHIPLAAAMGVAMAGLVPVPSAAPSAPLMITAPRWATSYTASRMAQLTAAISASKHILDLKNDWDDAGSPGYSHSTWESATSFVRHQFEKSLGKIDIPKILPGPDGSIDLHWQSDRYELLINITGDDTIAEFYGDDKGRVTAKGSLDIHADNHGLLLWMMSR